VSEERVVKTTGRCNSIYVSKERAVKNIRTYDRMCKMKGLSKPFIRIDKIEPVFL
jgi:hypothetical protein